MERRAAYNGRFGASGAVIPQTILCGFVRLSPAGMAVEAPPSPSRWDVMRQRWSAVRLGSEKKERC